MKRIMCAAAVLVAGLMLAGGASLAQNGEDSAVVTFNLDKFIELEITDGASVDLGPLDPTTSQVSAQNATTLAVTSNTKWQIGVDKTVQNAPDGAENVADQLDVQVAPPQGRGDKSGIQAGYTLNGVDELPAGEYAIEVTYTATTR